MKLRPDFEVACSNLMNRHPVPSLDVYLNELLHEEQLIITQAAMKHGTAVASLVPVAYAAQGRHKDRDVCCSVLQLQHFWSYCLGLYQKILQLLQETGSSHICLSHSS